MGFKEVKAKANDIRQAVIESSMLVGAKNASNIIGIDVPVGLGLTTYSKSLNKEAEHLKNSSMFKILFMGTFKNGKSTTINALLGGDLLPVGAIATTAVISQVVYGEDTNTVKVIYENNDKVKTLSMDRFSQEYRLSDEDLIMIENEGKTDRFKDVDSVVIQSNLEIFKDGVQFIDSPGLGEAVARTKTTNKFIPQANAIVFILDAQKLFSEDERAFIRKHFVNVDPKPRNVFFLINRINQLNNDLEREAVKRQVKLTLKPVFTDETGYNEGLYNERVFFVNSYGALQMQKEGNSPIGTGIIEFKTALERFLTSEERVIAKYKSVVANMAGVYVVAQKQIEDTAALLKQDVSVLEKNRADAEKKLKELSIRVENIEKAIDRTKRNITNKIINSLETFVKLDLVNDWPAYVEKYDEAFGISDMIKLALPIGDEKKEEILYPMVKYVNGYVKEKLETWSDSIPMLINIDIDSLKDELNDQTIAFDFTLEQAKSIFSGADSSNWNGQGANKLQLALSLIQGDVSVAVENAAGGNFSWGDFFKKYLVQAVINILIMSLVGGGIPGLLAFIITETVQLKMHTGSSRTRLLNGFAEGLFPKITNELLKNKAIISEDISRQFDKTKAEITDTAYALINEEKQHEDDIIKQARQKKDEIASEEIRQRKILDALFERTNLIYNILFGKELAKNDIEKVAAMIGNAEN